MTHGLSHFVETTFGVSDDLFQAALELSPGSQGSIAGAISEILLLKHLESKGYEALRIKEKPSGGNNAKNIEARGDFYFRKSGSRKDEWWVIESKGLKSNSEFRGGKLDSAEKVFNFLKSRVFDPKRTRTSIYTSGFERYEKARIEWESKNRRKSFPPFGWDKNFPGAESFDLSGIWKNSADLENWVRSLSPERFTEDAYRARKGPIAILETHQPSQREAPITGKTQAAPLVSDFNIMAVDLFFRTGEHTFAFMDSNRIAHSPTSPEHLYQNYTIDILVPDLKSQPLINPPWYSDIDSLIGVSKPQPHALDPSQLDNRNPDEE